MRFLVVALLLPSCSPSSEPTPIDTAACKAMSAHPLRGISPAKPLDYLGLRRPSSGTSPPGAAVDEIGRPCATASDVAACLALVDALAKGTGWVTDGAIETMVATVKDDVVPYQSPADLARLLAPIDSAEKAALLVRSSGRLLACDVSPVVEIPGGYRVTTTRFGCGETVRVSTAGEIDELDVTTSTCSEGGDAGFIDTGAVFDIGGVDTGAFDTGEPTSLDAAVDGDGLESAPPADASE